LRKRIKSSKEQKDLWLVRIVALLLILLTFGVGGHVIKLLFYAIALLSLITIPLLAAIWGLKTTQRPIWIATGLSAMVFFVVMQFDAGYLGRGALKYHAWLVAITVNAISFFITCYFERNSKVALGKKKRGAPFELTSPGIMQQLMSWLGRLGSPAAEARKKLQTYGSAPFAFSWFVFILFMVPIWSENHLFMATVHVGGIVLCCGLLGKSVWPTALRPYFALYYFWTAS